MAKIKRRGASGAAKNYITRSQAIRKLQISLADFRRLCILKGIYPREPYNKKKANKGSSAPASFYYQKDIQYLLHEPLLQNFRDHKAFAKKLSRAVGRGEWALAKNLEDAKPVARLDHLVKERYPTFTLALQDLQDPLNLIHLFSTLPTAPVPGGKALSPDAIYDCSRLISEWKLWILRTHALRYVFLGIKGIYYEAMCPGHGGEPVRVRWMEGYEFQQHVPVDVDFRILLTFLELYRTLVGFVLYRLYTQENLVYPPPLDEDKAEEGAGLGALQLVQKQEQATSANKVSNKDVRKAIRTIKQNGATDADFDMDDTAETKEDGEAQDEDFVERPTKEVTVEDVSTAPLTTYSSIVASSTAAPSTQKLLFAPYTFYLSRETSSRTWEFVIRALGGRVITALAAPVPGDAPEADAITHVIIDRPTTPERMREMQGPRKWTWVQPQWVADCINRDKILGADEYGPGKLLPPHLSPWEGEGDLARPWLEKNEAGETVNEAVARAQGEGTGMEGSEDEEAEEGEEDEEEDEEEEEEDHDADEEAAEDDAAPAYPPALLAAAQKPSDSTLLHAAELEAEQTGVSHAAFEAQLKEARKTFKSTAGAGQAKPGKTAEEDLRKTMMSNKKRRLYEKMQRGNAMRAAEQDKLEQKRKAIEKRKAKEARAGKV